MLDLPMNVLLMVRQYDEYQCHIVKGLNGYPEQVVDIIFKYT
jgi:hypothetical protein